MPFILAIEPDRQQASGVAALAPSHLDADILVVGSVEEALATLETARPDLVLTPLLLSAKDDAALTARLRGLDDNGIELQTLVIPVLASSDAVPPPVAKSTGLLTRIRKPRSASATTAGCAPAVFAAQIREYLARMAAERNDREETERSEHWPPTHRAASAPMLGELLTVPTPQRDEREWQSAADAYFPVPALAQGADPVLAQSPEPDAAIEPHLDIEDSERAEAAAWEAVESGSAVPDDAPPVPDSAPAADVEPLAENRPGVSSKDAAWEWDDVESFLEDLGLDHRVAVAGAITDDLAADEPAVLEPSPANELWQPLGASPQQQTPPIEGPALRRRPKPSQPKPPKPTRPTAAQARPAGSRPRKPKTAQRPMQDEWGLYDPEQCGFAALLERVDEITRTEAEEKKEGEGRSAIMRR